MLIERKSNRRDARLLGPGSGLHRGDSNPALILFAIILFMKLTLLYKLNTPADRDIEYFKRKLDEIRIPLNLVDADSQEGAALTELYDAVDRPALILTDIDGRLQQIWQKDLPPISEIQGAYRSQ